MQDLIQRFFLRFQMGAEGERFAFCGYDLRFFVLELLQYAVAKPAYLHRKPMLLLNGSVKVRFISYMLI
ncbi:hypothetical protein [Serratia marcescens]|uniref:hypothetical protein n=1 Tax=Serratia marcescens TaxID=615 RepID=UPI001EF9B4B5|nr:hypothetical protein [Serratia marcescens]